MSDYIEECQQLLEIMTTLKTDLDKHKKMLWNLYKDKKGYPIIAEDILKDMSMFKQRIDKVFLTLGG